MQPCAKCGKPMPWSHARWFGPGRLAKCQACGPWTQAEQAQVHRRIAQYGGAIPVRAGQGCGCIGKR